MKPGHERVESELVGSLPVMILSGRKMAPYAEPLTPFVVVGSRSVNTDRATNRPPTFAHHAIAYSGADNCR